MRTYFVKIGQNMREGVASFILEIDRERERERERAGYKYLQNISCANNDRGLQAIQAWDDNKKYSLATKNARGGIRE